MSAVDFAAVKALQLSAVIGQSLKLKRNGREWVGCCPFHQERTPSFTVNDDKGFAHCFGCGWHGDAADFVAAIAGCGLREAAERLGAGDLPTMSNRSAPTILPEKSETEDAARHIWREAGPVKDTPAESYLRRRGIHIAPAPTLRFAKLRHPEGGVHPCMVLAIVSDENKLTGVQRTYLADDGSKADVSVVKLSLGRVAGGAIRLAPVASELIVCEGAEDGLTLQQELGRAVWAAAGASMLSAMRFPSCVRSVVIAADNDAAGDREAHKAAEAFMGRGLAVRIMRPSPGFKDFNQELMATASAEAGRAAA